MSHRAAIVGAGPAGFYAAERLLSARFHVDLYDMLPTPFGLVRAGVAPDHPKIKSVTRVYDMTAAKEGFRFFGGVRLGSDVRREELLERYHAVVYAVGTPLDNRLGIAGEDRPGSVAATDFVAWYNGHPHFADLEPPLHVRRAVVIGNGNVALDVARMLVLGPDVLASTDTADHAIAGFRAASVREVIVIGRRGPAQAAFTNPELRELGELAQADVIVDPADLEGDPPENLSPTQLRNLEILRGYASRALEGKSHRIELRFLHSPVELVGDERDGQVKGIRMVRNEVVNGSAVPTGEEQFLECGLVVRAIGYRGHPLLGVPFDEERGLIRNEGGRVIGDYGEPLPGEYVVGWIKRGSSGVIGSNKKDAQETTTKIFEDAEAGRLNTPSDTTDAEVWLGTRLPSLVTWERWQRIDAYETATGEAQGRPRVKLVQVPALLAAARRDR
jgi:ferredoxin--NADP+ reductase